MRYLIIKFKAVSCNQEGATAVEYAIIASLIAAVIVVVVMAVGEKTLALFQTVVF